MQLQRRFRHWQWRGRFRNWTILRASTKRKRHQQTAMVHPGSGQKAMINRKKQNKGKMCERVFLSTGEKNVRWMGGGRAARQNSLSAANAHTILSGYCFFLVFHFDMMPTLPYPYLISIPALVLEACACIVTWNNWFLFTIHAPIFWSFMSASSLCHKGWQTHSSTLRRVREEEEEGVVAKFVIGCLQCRKRQQCRRLFLLLSQTFYLSMRGRGMSDGEEWSAIVLASGQYTKKVKQKRQSKHKMQYSLPRYQQETRCTHLGIR